MVFEAARDDVHEQLDDRLHGSLHLVKQHEPNDNGSLVVEAERVEQRLVINKSREQRKQVKHVHLVDGKQLGGVALAPVTELMGQHRLDFLVGALFEKRVEDDNLLFPWKSREVGIAVRAPLAPVDDLQLRKRKLELVRKSVDCVLQRARLERSELVENRNDPDRVDSNEKYGHNQGKDPYIVKKALAGSLDNPERRAADWSAESNHKTLRLNLVHDPKLHRHLVEAEFLF